MATAQPSSTLRYRVVTPGSDPIRFDTLSIVPGTFLLINRQGDTIPDTAYTLVPWEALLQLHPTLLSRNDTDYLAMYRLFPSPVMPYYYDRLLKPEPELRPRPEGSYLYSLGERRTTDPDGIFGFGDLQRSGSISRSVSIGNNQDAVLNSTMNLQLAGEIAPGVTITAAITDNTMPIQPDGSSQQLREFDKVYIGVNTDSWELSAGDIELHNGAGRFMVFSRKGQGLLFGSTMKAGREQQWTLTTRVSGSVAKGKFHTNRFSGIEGNQGPYKLTGASNELFIMVLAGTEQVYLDGRLLTRGANNDYVIDYNTAQITFTPNRTVTREMRFMVTFEYAERNYNRSMAYMQQQATNGRASLSLQFFTEQDIRSQPMSQEQLLKENMELLNEIGDDLSGAVVPNVKEVPFNNSEVLYKRIDTLAGSVLFEDVYVYSVDPDSARYRVGFSFVGTGRGHYRLTTSAANGKVYEWVAPIGGTLLGDYEPVILLVTPKRQQMLTLGGTLQATPALSLFAEGALSLLDLNTFSSKDNDDNLGLAFTTGFRRQRPREADDTTRWHFSAEGLYRYVQRRFAALDRFREVEFDRDWNLTGEPRGDEHYGKVSLQLAGTGGVAGDYTFEPLFHGSNDYALRHSLTATAAPGPWRLLGRGSYTENMNSYLPARFLRHHLTMGRRAPHHTITLLSEGENNRQRLPGTGDTLFGSSFAFQRWEATMETGSDTAKVALRLRAGQRYDYLPAGEGFNRSARADEVWTGIATRNTPNHQLSLNIGYRKLHLNDTAGTARPEESLLGRGEYNHRLWRGVVRGNIFYEFGSGLEYKKEYTYLEVAPGQGVYTWIDYNGDSIKQLNEFEIAVFQDEANYIRVFTPTNAFERVYTMHYSQTLNIDPAIVADRSKASGRLLARFSGMGHYRVEQKMGGENITAALNPWQIAFSDTALISLSYSLRNTIFFNRSSSKYGIEYTLMRNASRMLLVNGFEERGQTLHQVRARWNISRAFILRSEGTTGVRERASEFFAANDYTIALNGGALELQYQPGTQYRVGAKYTLSDKRNSGTGNEHAILHRLSTEFRHSAPMKGSLQAIVEYIGISYNSTGNNTLAFEMLEGLQPGNNFTWTLAYQRTLANNMQVNVQYNGRKSAETPAVHVGTVQVRAFF
jgi:hypothetical protein